MIRSVRKAARPGRERAGARDLERFSPSLRGLELEYPICNRDNADGFINGLDLATFLERIMPQGSSARGRGALSLFSPLGGRTVIGGVFASAAKILTAGGYQGWASAPLAVRRRA